jgi:hypothetical protein
MILFFLADKCGRNQRHLPGSRYAGCEKKQIRHTLQGLRRSLQEAGEEAGQGVHFLQHIRQKNVNVSDGKEFTKELQSWNNIFSDQIK